MAPWRHLQVGCVGSRRDFSARSAALTPHPSRAAQSIFFPCSLFSPVLSSPCFQLSSVWFPSLSLPGLVPPQGLPVAAHSQPGAWGGFSRVVFPGRAGGSCLPRPARAGPCPTSSEQGTDSGGNSDLLLSLHTSPGRAWRRPGQTRRARRRFWDWLWAVSPHPSRLLLSIPNPSPVGTAPQNKTSRKILGGGGFGWGCAAGMQKQERSPRSPSEPPNPGSCSPKIPPPSPT